MPTFDLELDIHKTLSTPVQQVVIRAGDVDSQVIKAHLMDNGADYKPPSGSKGRLEILKADHTWVRLSASISGNVLTSTLNDVAVSSPGMARLAYFVVETNGARASTEGFELRVLDVVEADPDTVKSYDDDLEQLCLKWLSYESTAERHETGRVTAENGRVRAENQRVANENQRIANENTRQDAERARATAEDARKQAEDKREVAENGRSSNETQRARAETARETASNTAAKAANDAAEKANQAAKAALGAFTVTSPFSIVDGQVCLTHEED